MIPRAPRFAAAFNGSSIEVNCESALLAEEIRLRLGHLMRGSPGPEASILRLTLVPIESGWIEIRDSTGRLERGQLDHVVHYARRWAVEGFMEAHPRFLWLHAAAAARDDAAVLLCGSAGAGKSTLAVQLIDQGWTFVADDVVPVDRTSGLALPMPCTPCVRTGSPEESGDPDVFLEQSKRVIAVASDRVATTAHPVGAVVFPEFSRGAAPIVSPLSAASAAWSLTAQCLRFDEDKALTIGSLFRLAESTPAFHLVYGDPASAAALLTLRWPELKRGS